MTHYNPLQNLMDNFTLRIADTEDLKIQEYHFRYHIFCQEFHFEREENCPNQLEQDIYDEQAIHLQIYQNNTSSLVGSIRLALPSKQNNSQPMLPFERFSESAFLPENNNIKLFAEASRLAVHPDYRRRRYDGDHASGINTDIVFANYYPERYFPVVAVSMMLGSICLANIIKLERLFAMMEPKLNHVLANYGIYFKQIGYVTNYHGERAPFVMIPEEISNTIRPDLAEMLHYIHSELSTEILQKKIA